MPKVVITDYTFPNLELEDAILSTAGCELVAGQCKTTESLIELVADADAVITQFAPVNADVVSAMDKAKVIVRYGIGYDNVACEVARQKNIPVCNVPSYCIDEVADHTLAFILSMTRQLRANCSHIVQGKWGLAVPINEMRALRDQTVGLIGLGRIGQSVADRLKAFKCKVLAADPVISSDDAANHGCQLVSIDELLEQSDIVSLHCPSTDSTRGIINQTTLNQMKAGSILINVGRGDLVDLDALTSAVENGHISATALDVFDPEPLDPTHPLIKRDNVIVSSHIASCSPTAAKTLRESAANLAIAGLRGEELPSVVN